MQKNKRKGGQTYKRLKYFRVLRSEDIKTQVDHCIGPHCGEIWVFDLQQAMSHFLHHEVNKGFVERN